MNAKKVQINYKGKPIEIGSLSKNELCRGLVETMKELEIKAWGLNVVIGNIKASADAV